jgi:hypothetical protein
MAQSPYLLLAGRAVDTYDYKFVSDLIYDNREIEVVCERQHSCKPTSVSGNALETDPERTPKIGFDRDGLRRLRIFGQRDKLKANRSKGA